MFKLKFFGTPQLEGPSGGAPQPGPRRLALLASLAAAGTAGLTRDKVVARLWPEADDDRARRNLSQVLYSMKSELGADLVEGTGILRLDPALCWSDIAAFDAAIAEHRDGDAIALYAGNFLDGSIRGLPHCEDTGCIMEDGHCVATVHAEANAIIQAAKNGVSLENSELYTTASPCWNCFKLIVNTGIRRIYYGELYRDERSKEVARELGIELVDLEIPPPVR